MSERYILLLCVWFHVTSVYSVNARTAQKLHLLLTCFPFSLKQTSFSPAASFIFVFAFRIVSNFTVVTFDGKHISTFRWKYSRRSSALVSFTTLYILSECMAHIIYKMRISFVHYLGLIELTAKYIMFMHVYHTSKLILLIRWTIQLLSTLYMICAEYFVYNGMVYVSRHPTSDWQNNIHAVNGAISLLSVHFSFEKT